MPAKILFILSGSIACYKACVAISQLVQRGHEVRTVATTAALKFVGVATLEGLTRGRVWTDLFEPGAALEHITLARWADIVVICPATANTLNRMSAGLGDDLAGALLLAHEWSKPLLIAPAMNPAMWSHPATQASVRRLREWGARFVDIGSGRTACGEVGEGRLPEPEEIVAAIEAVIAPPRRRLRILVTSGGTAEPIDAVRVLTNSSTGATGALMAGQFAQMGHDVVLLRAKNAQPAHGAVREETFGSFADLDNALGRILPEEHFDVVVHAAAVSDFSVHSIEINGAWQEPGKAKLPSTVTPTLRLRPNPKLLDSIRARSRNPGVRIFAFKLTEGASADDAHAAVHRLLAGGAADFVVHNDLAARAEKAGTFPADVWDVHEKIVAHCADRDEIAPAIGKLLESPGGAVESASADNNSRT
jgi:phosphopantothenoylcysteine decarboxylase/phosphopantothenate--cysteine ligase